MAVKVLLIASLVLSTYGTAIETSSKKVPHCAEIVITASNSLQIGQCYINTSEESHFNHLGIEATAPVNCTSKAGAAADETYLCAHIPATLTVAAAPNNTIAHCEVYMYNTAAWAVCNANHCGQNTFIKQQAVCKRIQSTCASEKTGGYIKYGMPNGLSSLYKQGAHDNISIVSNCHK